MALGYEIGTIMRRKSILFKSADEELTVKLDDIENLGEFVQVGRFSDLIINRFGLLDCHFPGKQKPLTAFQALMRDSFQTY